MICPWSFFHSGTGLSWQVVRYYIGSTSFLISLACLASADDWPQWLGPERDGVWRESGILDRFPPDGPKLLWSTLIGGGYSGPTVADGRVFVLDWFASGDTSNAKLLHDATPPDNTNFVRKLLPGTERVVCLRETDGKILWTHEYECDYTMVATYANGPRVTPAIADGHVYSLGAEGKLLCLSTADGTVVWERNLKKDYDVETPLWGFASHPLVHGRHLYCMVGGKEATVVAFDKQTGKELWRALDAVEPGYAPPMISEFGGERQLVTWDSEHVSGLDLTTGETFWHVEAKPTFGMSIGLARATDNAMYLMSYNRQSWLVQVAADGHSAAVDWYSSGSQGIGGVMNTPLLEGEYVYGCGPEGRYVCSRLRDGERMWSTFQPSTGKRPASWANVFTVKHQDRSFLVNDLGDVIIACLSPEGYQELSRAHLIDPDFDIGGRRVVWSHPAFANKHIYLRNEREIRCYSLAAEKE